MMGNRLERVGPYSQQTTRHSAAFVLLQGNNLGCKASVVLAAI